jgi:hypothetical protein
MMPTDEQYDAPMVKMDGMQRQLEIASKSGCEYQVQVAEHYKKSYYLLKAYETLSGANDFYYNKTEIKPKGRKRLVKVDAGVVTVLREHMGEKV